jgi:hypothetical protein
MALFKNKLQSFKKKILIESNLSRIHQHTKESNIGILTAFRGEFDIKQNSSRNKELQSAIRSNGFGFIPVAGHYIENKGSSDERDVIEDSFIVISNKDDSDKLKKFLIKMGVKYNQDSILYKPAESPDAFLIGTASGRYPGMGVETNAGKFHPSRMGKFYSQLRNGKTFVFESINFIENLLSRFHRENLTENKK